jgi:hypothetical protein
MPSDVDTTDGNETISLTQFIEGNQRLLAVLGVFIAIIVVSGQIGSAWSNVFRGTCVLLALIVWLEVASNLLAVGDWWKMPRHSLHQGAWIGREQRMYWFGLLMVIGFVLFCAYLLVSYPVTSLYVVLAVLHSPIHLFLLHRCTGMRIVQGRSEKTMAILANAISGGITLMVIAVVALLVLAVARNFT